MFLQVKDINKSYRKYGKIEKQQVLKDVNFIIKEGECVGLLGESGSILIEDLNVKKWIKENQGKMSVVFQDYTSSANPNFTVKEIILEPLKVLGKKENLDKITEDLLDRYLHELSGGQLQKVCIARSISTKPKFIVLDEAIS